MSLNLHSREVGKVAVLSCFGRITLNDGAVTLRNALHDLVERGTVNIVLNLAEADYIDSSGVGEIFAGLAEAKKHGGDLKLLSLTKKTRDLLQLTKLCSAIEAYDDEARAISSFD